MNKSFKKTHFYFALGATILFLALATWRLDNYVYQSAIRENTKILTNSLTSLSQSLLEHKESQLQHLKYNASTKTIVNIAKRYVQKKIGWKEVNESVKNYLTAQLHEHNLLGYFLIAKDGLSLASSRDSNVGRRNLIVDLDDIWLKTKQNQTFITRPIKSDVNLIKEGHSLKTNYTMFMITPVLDGDRTLMYLAYRVSPENFFWNFLEHERIGESGESYIIDKDGFLLSHSRFQDDLKKIITKYEPGDEIYNVKLPHIIDGDSPLMGIHHEQSGSRLTPYPDYRGTPVIGTWKWLEDYQVGLVIKRDFEEAFKNHHESRGMIWVIFTCVSLLITLIASLAWKGFEGIALAAEKMEGHLGAVDATVISYDPLQEFKILSVNDHLPRLLNVPKSQIIGTSLLKWIHPEDHDSFKSSVMHHLIEKSTYEQNFRLKSDKKDIHILEKAQFQKHGESYRVEGFLSDITEQKQMSKRLMKQITLSSVFQILLKQASKLGSDRELFHFVLELLVDYKIAEIHSGSAYSIDDNKILHIICENGESSGDIEGFVSRWEDSTRLKSQVRQGQPVTETIDDKTEELYLPVQNKGKVVSLLKLNKTNFENFDSQEIQFLLSLVNIVSEILHRIEVDEELELQRKNQVKTERLSAVGEISDSLAHEINNPLMIIKGMTKLMKRNVEKGRYERLAKTLKDVDKAADRISLLVSSLRLFNRNHHTKMEQVDFKPFFTSLMIDTSIMAEKQEILLKYYNNLDGCLFGDKEELKFVLMKYITECTNVVRTQMKREIQISTRIQDGRVFISIMNAYPPTDAEIMKNSEGDDMVENKIEGVNLWKNVIELNMGTVEIINDHVEHGFEISLMFEPAMDIKKSA